MTYLDLPFISKVTENREAFGNEVIALCDRIGWQPSWLMIVMNNESGLNSHIRNLAGGSATGLIQFTAATAADLGTTTDALAAMSNVDQLNYVEMYLTKYGYASRVKDVGDAYLTVFYPAALWKDDAFVFPQWATNANPTFDIDHNGTLTKAEFKQYVNQKYGYLIPKEETEAFETKKKVKGIVWVIIAVVAVAGIGYLIYKNW